MGMLLSEQGDVGLLATAQLTGTSTELGDVGL